MWRSDLPRLLWSKGFFQSCLIFFNLSQIYFGLYPTFSLDCSSAVAHLAATDAKSSDLLSWLLFSLAPFAKWSNTMWSDACKWNKQVLQLCASSNVAKSLPYTSVPCFSGKLHGSSPPQRPPYLPRVNGNASWFFKMLANDCYAVPDVFQREWG